MTSAPPTVLVLGHSFIRHLRDDLSNHFDPRACMDFNLCERAIVSMFGIGGRTIRKLQFDLHVIKRLKPQIIILEIGTNDLSHTAPKIVVKNLVKFVRLLLDEYSTHVVGVCHVIPRRGSFPNADSFNESAHIFNCLSKPALESIPNVFCWTHRGISNPSINLYLPDGVHVNAQGQYLLYRSYRGAILKALRMFQ